MEKVKFNVSSKTARLIGRENISDSNGAIIELVKNAYDADADSVYIKINIIFEKIPDKIIISEDKKYFSEEEYNEFVNNAKEASFYDTGKDAEYGDQLMTLSTCSYHTEDGRFAVVARKKWSKLFLHK